MVELNYIQKNFELELESLKTLTFRQISVINSSKWNNRNRVPGTLDVNFDTAALWLHS